MDTADFGMGDETRDTTDRWMVADDSQELGKLRLITGGAPIGPREQVSPLQR